RVQLVGSLSSKRQNCPLADLSTNSPRSMYQVDGPNRVTKASQPGLSLSVKFSGPAAVLVSVIVQIDLPEPRTTDQSPAIWSAASPTGLAAAAAVCMKKMPSPGRCAS